MESSNRPSVRVGLYLLDGRTWEITRDGKRIPLSKIEFDVLYQLASRRGGIVLRREFEPWRQEGEVDRRNPVDTIVVQIRKKLGGTIIATEIGKGYRLGDGLSVEVVASPSLSKIEQLLSIASNQVNEHTHLSFRAAIGNCEELLKTGKIEDAYAVLALAYINLGHLGMCRELPTVAIAKANGIIGEALKHFPTFGSAYALKGLTALIHDYDWGMAEKNFRKALELSPHNELGHQFISHLLVARGDFDEGLGHAHIAADLNYKRALTAITEPWLMMYAGRVVEAVCLGEEVVKRFQTCAPAHAILGHIYQAAGENNKAIEQYEFAMNIEFLPEVPAALGYVKAQLGYTKEALRTLGRIDKAREEGRIAYAPSFFKALVYVGMGEVKKSLDALERAHSEKSDWLIHLGVDPRWKELRHEKRFMTLMRRVGIKMTSKA